MLTRKVYFEMEGLFEEFMNWRLQTSPEFSTCIGFHEQDAYLESYSLKSFEESKAHVNAFLQRATELVPKLKNEQDLQNLKLFVTELQTFLDGAKYNGYVAPINYFEGPQVDLEQILSYMPKETVKDFENIVARFIAFPRQAEEIIEIMRYSVSNKITAHSSSMNEVLDQFAALQVPTESSVFYKPFLNIPQSISSEERIQLATEGKKAVGGYLLPGFRKLAAFIENEYMKACRPNISATSLPDGKAYYAQLLRFHLSCDMSPDDIHAIGLTEVERISQEMHKVIESLGFQLTIHEFSEKIRCDPQSYFSTADDLLNAYKEIVRDEITPKLGTIFNYIPKAKLFIEPQRDSQAGGPLAYYLSGSQDGTRPGVFYCNVSDLKSVPKYEMRSLALHEGLPGHHLQCSYMIEMPNIPKFRRYMEDRKYCTSPARFPINTSFIEGWGLYSEYLGEELGLYQDPYSLYGRLSQEMFRACRLVVDTGLHSFGWTKERAIDFMMQNTASGQQHIEKEINRYILWPGQACAYKIGELRMKSLRVKAKKALGDKFDIRSFHDVLLKSSGPISFVEEQVEKYIASQ